MTLDREQVRAALPAYEIGGELGRGGWGVVLEARHLRLGREVAIKQLPGAFSADPSVRARFVAAGTSTAVLAGTASRCARRRGGGGPARQPTADRAPLARRAGRPGPA